MTFTRRQFSAQSLLTRLNSPWGIFALGTFQQLTNSTMLPWRRRVWENTENQRGSRKRGGKISLRSGACPTWPTPRVIGILCCQTAASASAASIRNIKNRKVSFLWFLSISLHSMTHTHTLVLPLQQNKLPSRKQYALADGLASWKWNAPQPTASRRRGLIKRGCCSCWCLPSLNVFCPAVILSLSATKYEHSCRKNRLPAYCHWHNVWLKSSHDEKCLVVKSGLFWFHLSCDGENKISCLGAATFAWKRLLLLCAAWEATRHRWWPLWRLMNTPTLPRHVHTHTP